MTHRTRRALTLLAAGLVLGLSASADARPKKVTVNMSEFAFTPAYIQVSVGDTVEWKNVGAAPHTATSGYGLDDPAAGTLFDSGTIAPGGTYRKVFTAAGRSPYFCIPHEPLGMKGAVSVVVPPRRRINIQVNDNISQQLFFFSPANTTASPGDTIRWTNVGQTVHTVTSGTYGGPDMGVLFDSGAMDPGDAFTWIVADTSGVLNYHCLPHAELGMTGTLTIQAAAAEVPDAPVAIEPQAFPNPSHGAVVLTFGLPAGGPLAVEVIDATGRLAARLFEGAAPAGPQRFAWSGRHPGGDRVAAGQYFYRITSGAGAMTGRLVLLP